MQHQFRVDAIVTDADGNTSIEHQRHDIYAANCDSAKSLALYATQQSLRDRKESGEITGACTANFASIIPGDPTRQ